MPKFKGFLTKTDAENIDVEAGEVVADDEADAKYNIRQRTVRALDDLEHVARVLDPDDFGRIMVGWWQREPARSPVERMSDILSLFWIGSNLRSHVGHRDRNGSEFVNMGDEDDNEVRHDSKARPGYSAVDWENWIERAIRSSEPTAYVNVLITTYSDGELDDLLESFLEGEATLSDVERTALFRTNRVDPGEFDGLPWG